MTGVNDLYSYDVYTALCRMLSAMQGGKKIEAIREFRNATKSGLKESKEMVEALFAVTDTRNQPAPSFVYPWEKTAPVSNDQRHIVTARNATSWEEYVWSYNTLADAITFAQDLPEDKYKEVRISRLVREEKMVRTFVDVAA